jgi:hypothetical protein
MMMMMMMMMMTARTLLQRPTIFYLLRTRPPPTRPLSHQARAIIEEEEAKQSKARAMVFTCVGSALQLLLVAYVVRRSWLHLRAPFVVPRQLQQS